MTDAHRLLESRRSRIGRWAGAAAVVCTLHVCGVALALMSWHDEEEDGGTAGAMTVEMVPLPAVARVDTPEVAQGPLTQEVRPMPEASEKVEEEVVENLPPVPPSPAPKPEIALPKPPPEEKKEEPEKEEPKQAASEKQKPAEAMEQQFAMAPPRVEAQSAPKASLGQSATLAQATWAKAAFRHFERFRGRYPEAARRRGQQGTVRVRFRVDRSGHVISAHILKGSGVPLLDEEVFAWLKRSSPFPLPPDQVPEPDLELVGTIYFKIE